MKALIAVDVQNDFLPGGKLAVDDGDAVIPEILELAQNHHFTVTTGDSHPAGTKHFEKWPEHCVEGTPGEDIHPAIFRISDAHMVKGNSMEDDGYSGFEGTEISDGATLEQVLEGENVTDVTVVGLALDYCVKATALDAQKAGFGTTVLLDATRPVDQATGDEAIKELRAAGVTVE